jgi:TolB-like protein
VRSAWIAFVGRIVAQFVGSAATIVLGLMLLQKHAASEAKFHDTAAAATESRVQPIKTRPVEPTSVAVLPLRGFAADGTSALADSMTDALTSELAQIPGVHVASLTSATHAARQAQSAGDIASTLGVHYFVEGSAVHADDRVRISVRLVDALRDEHVWAHQYEERNTNLTEARLARTAARELGAALTSAADAVDAGDQADPLAASARMGVVARAR